MIYEIKSRYSSRVLFSGDYTSRKDCVEAAVKVGADLRGADLQGAYLQGTDLHGADLTGTDLRGANLQGAYLHGAYLHRADLRGAYLQGTDLHGANLRGTDLRGANLQGAYLHGADLHRADLRGLHIIDGGQDQRGYRFWCWTKDGKPIVRAGCREWEGFDAARAHYGDGYDSDGNRAECLARIALMESIWNEKKEGGE